MMLQLWVLQIFQTGQFSKDFQFTGSGIRDNESNIIDNRSSFLTVHYVIGFFECSHGKIVSHQYHHRLPTVLPRMCPSPCSRRLWWYKYPMRIGAGCRWRPPQWCGCQPRSTALLRPLLAFWTCTHPFPLGPGAVRSSTPLMVRQNTRSCY